MTEQTSIGTSDAMGEQILGQESDLTQARHLSSLIAGCSIEAVPTLIDDLEAFPTPERSYRESLRRAKSFQERRWSTLDSALSAYEETFDTLLSETGGKMVDLLPHDQARPVVVLDVMATAAALLDLRHEFLRRAVPGAEFRGFAVGLAQGTQKAHEVMEDLHFINGNIRNPRTWDQLAEAMDGAQADLIVERAVGGLDGIPLHRKFYEVAFARLWPLLRPGGMLLLQTPDKEELTRTGLDIDRVVDNLNAQGVEARIDPEPPFFSGTLLVRKPEQAAKS